MSNEDVVLMEIKEPTAVETDEKSNDTATAQSSTENVEKIKAEVIPNYTLTRKEQEIYDESTAYSVKLENFDGPLDLLIYLVKEAKLDIEDLRLSMITEQYLSYMKDLDSIDIEKGAEFIEMAATLLEIKSKHIIPQEKADEDNPDDEERNILQRMKEYELFKNACEKLKDIENVNKFYREPDEKVNDFRIILKQMNMDNLINAFKGLLARAREVEKNEEVKTIQRDRFTVEEKIFEIKCLLMTNERLNFFSLVESDFTRTEIITLFMSILELLKMQVIKVEQEEMFGDIILIKADESLANVYADDFTGKVTKE